MEGERQGDSDRPDILEEDRMPPHQEGGQDGLSEEVTL